MPVGTQATVKTLGPDDLAGLGARLILANTYHLMLRPGAELVARLGGLHHFARWGGAMLTDSGGFQVLSLAGMRRISDEGVVFRSHVDGSRVALTPASAMRAQALLGADIAMVLDECPPAGAPRAVHEEAARRTLLWARQSLEAEHAPGQAVFAIVQGGTHLDLRRHLARELSALPFAGYAVGGLCVGETKQALHEVLAATTAELPRHQPRYLMGVGSPEDLWECVARGVDMFDCVLPTRIARNGALLTRAGRLNIFNARFREDPRPIEDGCGCPACARGFSRAYLRHLFAAREVLGLRLATLHNLHLLLQLTREIRAAILDGRFPQARAAFLAGYRPVDEATRHEQRARWLVSHAGSGRCHHEASPAR